MSRSTYRNRSARRALGVVWLALAVAAPTLGAQGRRAAADPDADPRRVPWAPVPELRLALPLADGPGAEAGVGLNVRAGWYVRPALAVLGGVIARDSGQVGTARVEAAVRFHLDPFSQARGCDSRSPRWRCRGLYGGLGVSQRWRGAGEGAEVPVFVLIAGIEGRNAPPTRRWVWGAEAALGGGLRVGVTARRRRADGYR